MDNAARGGSTTHGDRRASMSERLERKIMAICCAVLLLQMFTNSLTVAEGKKHKSSNSTASPSRSPSPSKNNTTSPAPSPQEASTPAPSPQSSANGPSQGSAPHSPSNEDPTSENVAGNLHAFRQYQIVAEGLDSVQNSLILPDMTLFAPFDDAFDGVNLTGESALALLKFHIIERRLNFSELLNLGVGTKLSTSLPNISVIITDNSSGHFMVDNALVINPDLYVDKHIAVHGIDSVLDAASYNTLQSLGPSSADNVSLDGPVPLQTEPTPYLGDSPPSSPGSPLVPSSDNTRPLHPIPLPPICDKCPPVDSIFPSQSPRPRRHRASFTTVLGSSVILGTTIFLVCNLL